MITHLSKSTLDFTSDLEKNNNRDWFAINKPRYESARKEFTGFIAGVMKGMQAFEPEIAHQEPKDTLFRIYRDVRFSNDKRPYKDHICAYLCADGRKSVKPGYYLHIKAGNQSFLAGGAWFPPSPELKALRQEIDYNYDELESLLRAPGFLKYFNGLEGERLKTTPKGYSADHKAIEHLRRKSFNFSHKLTDKQVLSPDFLEHTLNVIAAMKPMNDFLMRGYEAGA